MRKLKYREVLYQFKFTSLSGLNLGSLTPGPSLLTFAPFCPVPMCPMSAHAADTSLAYLNAIFSRNPVAIPTALSFYSTQQFPLCFMVIFIVIYCSPWLDPLFISATPFLPSSGSEYFQGRISSWDGVLTLADHKLARVQKEAGRLQGRQQMGKELPHQVPCPLVVSTHSNLPVFLSAADKHENTSLLSSSQMHQMVFETHV